jgi:hypothetical protein
MLKSAGTALFIAVAIQFFTVGVLAPRLPREVCRPGIQAERTFILNAAPVFRLVNTDGAVRILVDDQRRDIEVIARVRVYTSDAESQALAETYVNSLFQISEQPDMVSIITEPLPRPDPIDIRIDCTVEMPPGLDAAVDVSNGNVWVAAGCNNVAIEGNNSDIEVVHPKGTASIKTVNGRIWAQECASETTLETVNGSIHASLLGGALQASTITGIISATLLDAAVTGCDLTSLNGSITLVMPDPYSADINASTARGVVRADLLLEPGRGIQKRRAVHGKLGTGDTMISVNSMNGDIVLQRSAA